MVPARLSEYHLIQLAEHLIWLAGIVGLMILDRSLLASAELAIQDPIAGASAVAGEGPELGSQVVGD